MRRLGLIGGSGFDHWGEPVERRAVETPFGEPSDAFQAFERSSTRLWFLPRHGSDHGIAPHRVNYRANLFAFSTLEVEAVLTVNAVGSLDVNLPAGSLALPDQLIDYTHGRESSFHDGVAGDLDHVEFAEPFSHRWRAELLRAAEASGVAVRDGGCIAVTQGPRLETAAEIRRLARDGSDLVGMTSMPEAVLARELGLPYATLAVVANLAAGLEKDPITVEAIDRTLADAMGRVHTLIDRLLQNL
ncbi:MAG: S-methyl-5'-thioinosine phosphorylase [Xanthomonadales bacterium]|jgi:5'-deoxy-5'-methylthioadenosine phosphorylase|nr:S-methyl-5'-thioinosine phosphorylase [Xanthomonadales bacterium]